MSEVKDRVRTARQGLQNGMRRQDQTIEIDLVDLFFELLHYWLLIVLAAVLLGGALGFYNHSMVKPQYRAKAQIYITNSDKVIDIQNVQLSAALTVDYEEILLSYTVLQEVIDDLNLDMDWKALTNTITVKNPSDSHILKIEVLTKDKTLSLNIANTLIKYGIEKIYRIVGNDEPVVIDSAVEATLEVVKQSTAKMAVIGAFLGVLLVCGIVVLKYIISNTFSDQEDVESYTGYPVLASVPDLEESKNDAAKTRRKSGKKVRHRG